MHREPSLTYQGALRILGHHDRPWLDKLDALLGGVILGTGLLPATIPIEAMRGWVDQKNEAARLLQKMIDSLSGRLGCSFGHERHQLISAAHTTIVLTAFLETLRNQYGVHGQVEKNTIRQFLGGDARTPLSTLLYSSEVPAPSAQYGFAANTGRVLQWYSTLFDRFRQLLPEPGLFHRGLINSMVERYRSHYLSLAATIPEFIVWERLGEHIETRTAIIGIKEDLLSALNEHQGALARMEAVLNLTTAPNAGFPYTRKTLWRANRAVLNEPIVRARSMGYLNEVTFPRVGDIYVNPSYRLAPSAGHYGDDEWWERLPVHHDLDLLLAGHVSSQHATQTPMVLLGHPGAGKSLFTRVFAARMPIAAYTVVRVPLRHVGADSPVRDQVQQAIDEITNSRIKWGDLADESRETIRVVLFDGLDELLQAASGRRSGYLQQIADFQRQEAAQDAPLIAIVTSRNMVIDRMETAEGMTVVRLEPFNREQVKCWLDSWKAANMVAINSCQMHALTTEAAMSRPELAEQPLLLLMLALYSADSSAPPLTAELSKTELYQQLLNMFARREILKTSIDHEIDEKATEQLRRLSYAAIGMFNRGKQDITDVELGQDYLALEDKFNDSSAHRPDEIGQRILGEFFFVHRAEAAEGPSQPVRGQYEFLHTTFGEFLVATLIVETLNDLAHRTTGNRQTHDDNLLYALLSHQPLATSNATLQFIRQLLKENPLPELEQMRQSLTNLMRNATRRYGSTRYNGYRPVPVNVVRQLAAYTVNLVTLLTVIANDGEVPIASLWNSSHKPSAEWRSSVALWKAGLEPEGLRAVLTTLECNGTVVRPVTAMRLARIGQRGLTNEILIARLALEKEAEDVARLGAAIEDGTIYADHDDQWREVMFSSQLAMITNSPSWALEKPPAQTSENDLAEVRTSLIKILRQGHLEFGNRSPEELLELLNAHGLGDDGHVQALLVASYPDLLEKFPSLRSPLRYVNAASAPLILRAGEVNASDKDQKAAIIKLRKGIDMLVEPQSVPAMVQDLLRAVRGSIWTTQVAAIETEG